MTTPANSKDNHLRADRLPTEANSRRKKPTTATQSISCLAAFRISRIPDKEPAWLSIKALTTRLSTRKRRAIGSMTAAVRQQILSWMAFTFSLFLTA